MSKNTQHKENLKLLAEMGCTIETVTRIKMGGLVVHTEKYPVQAVAHVATKLRGLQKQLAHARRGVSHERD